MKDKFDTDEFIIRFLLGVLPKTERDLVEERYFSDPVYFERLCAVENALVDHYVRGQLSGKERGRFENHYLITPARRQKVAFAKSLARATSQVQTSAVREPEVSASWWQSFLGNWRVSSWVPQLAVAMALILLIGGLWAVYKINSLKRDLLAANQERNAFEQRQQELNSKIEELQRQIAADSTQSTELAKELELLREQQKELEKQQPQRQITAPVSPSIASFLLLPSSVRGSTEGAKTLVIVPQTDTIQLQVKFDMNDYSNYQVRIRTVDGSEVFSQRGLKAQAAKSGATLSIRILAIKLARNDYILTLSGAGSSGNVEEVERYFFRVEKK